MLYTSLLLLILSVQAVEKLNPIRILEEEAANYTLEDKDIYKLDNATYDMISTQCNFFDHEQITVAPWPTDCKVFQRRACEFF